MIVFKKRKLASLVKICIFSAMMGGSAFAATYNSQPTSTVIGDAPTIANVAITISSGLTNASVGDVLSVSGDFRDEQLFPQIKRQSDAPNATQIYTWYRDIGGNKVAIEGANEETYTLVDDDAGATISVKVVPTTDPSQTDPSQGTPVTSNEIVVASSTGLTGVRIEGLDTNNQPKVSKELRAVAQCASAKGSVDCTDDKLNNPTYKWYIETAVGSGDYTEINGATTSTYTPLAEQQKRKIKVSLDTE